LAGNIFEFGIVVVFQHQGLGGSGPHDAFIETARDFRIDPPQETEVNPFNKNSSDVSRRIQVRKTSQRARIFHRRLCRNFENYKED
ncbi:MAG: hypothetical protein Q4D11_05760, partial [Rhodospirillales bacterium]|nr:hypothetical protein [Rhodospirillales bacterium]